MNRYLEIAKERVLIYDGAMGTNIQIRQLSSDPSRKLTKKDYGGHDGWNENLVFTRPDVIEEVHASFLEVGCDVLETNTFGGSRLKLDEFGAGPRVLEYNSTAARLARKVADQYSTPSHPRFVAGSIGPTGMLPSTDDPALGKITYDELVKIFAEQTEGLVEGGVDLLLIETSQDILEVKAAITGIRRYFKTKGRQPLPIQAQVTLDPTGRMLLGTDIGAVVTILQGLRVDVIGLNCSTGPQEMRDSVRFLAENCSLPLSIIPNAGIPLNKDGQAFYPLDPDGLAKSLKEFVADFGVEIVGGCCGTTPAHLKAVTQALRGQGGSTQTRKKRSPVTSQSYVASTMKQTALRQQPAPTLIGERMNSQGSKKMKELLLTDQYDTICQIGRKQVDEGAHLLDLCLALTERDDEAVQSKILAKKLAQQVEAPLVIDSTDAQVIEACLKVYGGRPVVNSINMENGLERIKAVCPLVEEHGTAVVALTIDKDSGGMAKTAETKFAVAKKIHDYVTSHYQIRPEDLIFDALTFTLSTGDDEFKNSAVETLEGIRKIKAGLPEVHTTLGVSNVSFGLGRPARRILNSVFLHHAVQAGLDTAIVNPAEILPYFEIPEEERILADGLIFNRSPDALPKLITAFENKTVGPATPSKEDENFVNLSPEQKIHYKILHRKPEGIEALIDEVRQRRDPVDILNNVLLPAMKEVGDKFGAGELILPFVLQSAEAMKKAVAHLEQFLEKSASTTKGTVVLATVYGDVHDIGKNLVKTILSNNGYVVHDLGKQVPIQTILDKAQEVNADAIGLSALLVSTSRQMPACIEELYKRGMKYSVIIGGAAINRRFGRRIFFVEGQPYSGGVFYAKDAFEGLDIMNILTSKDQQPAFYEKVLHEAKLEVAGKGTEEASKTTVTIKIPRSTIQPLKIIPKPPFWGTRVLDRIDLREVFPLMDFNSLYRLSWGVKTRDSEEYKKMLKEKFEPLRLELQKEVLREGWFMPKVLYGFYPCQSEGETIHIYDPLDAKKRLTSFEFPRQPDAGHLCLADYINPVDSGLIDLIAFHLVTMGEKISNVCEDLNKRGDYSKSYYLHGLSVEATEGLASWIHQKIRSALGLKEEEGKRYSFGYPACPNLEDQGKLFSILKPEEAIGVTLTSAFQMIPEQSTSALIFHHPEATYYNVKIK
ncbi:MAG: methionine synthase [Deltaproteobacteria bacterium]|nr:methionine synthase [Deltaproteobacteria bacterium]